MTTLGLLGVILASTGIAAHYRSPRSTYLLGVSAVSHYFVIGAVVAGVLFATARGALGWIGLALAVVLIAWNVAVQAPAFVATTTPRNGHQVIVMTSNLRLGLGDAHSVVAAVRRHHVDVLMLEELTPAERAALHTAGLDATLPESLADPRGGGAGTGLWSRYPLHDGAIRHDLNFSLITARLAVPGSTTAPTFVALHMDGPYPSPQFPLWLQDITRLPAILKALPTDAPVIAAGDFNATTDVAQFRKLLHGGYADAIDQAGAGFIPTWPADRAFPPVIAIDHVLTRDAVANRVFSVHIPGSDHRALVAHVVLPRSATHQGSS